MVNLEGAGTKRYIPPTTWDAFERVWLEGLIRARHISISTVKKGVMVGKRIEINRTQ